MSIFDIATWPARQAFGVATRLVGGGSDDTTEQTPEQQQEQREQPTQRAGRPAPPAKDLDDVTIARKVESEIFRTKSIDKGKIDVNVVDGVAFLRGTAKTPAQIRTIEARATAIPEVKGVENLLHLPKTPARKQQPKRNQMPRTEPRRLNADKSVKAEQEPLPTEAAKEKKGRQPAKLGSSGGSDKSTATDVRDKGRFGREAGEGGGTEKRATTGVGTAKGPDAGAGEIVD